VRIRLEEGSANQVERIATPGRVTAMAYSPDARRLAYVVRRAGTTPACDRAELHLRDLATRTERVWNDGIPLTTNVTGGTFVTNVSWASDGTRIAYSAGVCCAGGGDLYVMGAETPTGAAFLGTRVPQPAGGTCHFLAPAYRGDVLTAVRSCPEKRQDAANGLVTLDERSGQVGDLLATIVVGEQEDVTRVAWEPGGTRVLVVIAKPDQPGQLLVWQLGDAAHPLPLAVRDVSW
jgi:dipeptidyl aminopeptidase/acylaminoacyl peptidase